MSPGEVGVSALDWKKHFKEEKLTTIKYLIFFFTKKHLHVTNKIFIITNDALSTNKEQIS